MDVLVQATNLPPYIDRMDAEKELEKAAENGSKQVSDSGALLEKDHLIDSNTESEVAQEDLQGNRINNSNDNLNEEGDSSK